MINTNPARLCLVAASTLALAPAAYAQDVGSANTGLEEVVVTARLRSETIQDAPLSVGVVDSAALERIGATSMNDLAAAMPGLIIQKGPSTSQSAISLRGLGSAPGVGSFESSVGLFVNGAYIPRTREFNSAMFDVERVEVVRGTQASLLGKNTSLGAVNVITRTPGSDFTYDLSTSYETELESVTAQGGITIPLSDRLSARLAGQHEELGGWVHNKVTGIDGEEVDRDAGRLSLAWTPSDTVDANLVYERQESETSGSAVEIIVLTPFISNLAAAAGYPGVVESAFDRVTQSTDSRVPDSNHEKSSVDRASLSAHWQLGDYQFTSLTGYTASEADAAADVDFQPGDYSIQLTTTDADSLSQEFRLSSPGEQRLRYVVGAFLGTNDFEQNTLADTRYGVAYNGTTTTYFDQSTDTWSAFGQTDYDLTDRLTMTLGLRYSDEKKEVDLARERPRYVGGPVLAPFAPFTLSRSESSTDGVVNLSFDVSNDLMVYASWAQGTKSGGYADSASNLAQSEYQPEVAQTAEVGVRFQNAARSLIANATLFHTYVEDYQLVTFNGSQFAISNTDLKSTGIESEIIWRPSFAQGLRVAWNNTYADARDADTGADIPRAPEWSGNLTLAYEHRLSAGWSYSLDTSVDYKSSVTHQQNPLATPRAPSITTFGAGVGLKADTGLAIRLIGKNLSDENTYTFAFPVPLSNGGAAASSERPRTVMLQLAYSY